MFQIKLGTGKCILFIFEKVSLSTLTAIHTFKFKKLQVILSKKVDDTPTPPDIHAFFQDLSAGDA